MKSLENVYVGASAKQKEKKKENLWMNKKESYQPFGG
jgi:hypothetical protein